MFALTSEQKNYRVIFIAMNAVFIIIILIYSIKYTCPETKMADLFCLFCAVISNEAEVLITFTLTHRKTKLGTIFFSTASRYLSQFVGVTRLSSVHYLISSVTSRGQRTVLHIFLGKVCLLTSQMQILTRSSLQCCTDSFQQQKDI